MFKFFVLSVVLVIVNFSNSFSWKYEYPEIDQKKITKDLIGQQLLYNGESTWTVLESEIVGIAINSIKKTGVLMFKKYEVEVYFQALENFHATNIKGQPSSMLINGTLIINYEKDKIISARFKEMPEKRKLDKATHYKLWIISANWYKFKSDFENFSKQKVQNSVYFYNPDFRSKMDNLKSLEEAYKDKNMRFQILNSFLSLNFCNVNEGIESYQVVCDYRPINEEKYEIGFMGWLDFVKFKDDYKISSFWFEYQSAGQ